MSTLRRLSSGPLACGLLLLAYAASPASAQEVQWRYDYNQARREAAEKGRPILLDFGTENCFWCKKLDATTFRDPAVAGLLNEQFIPVKIDANRDAPLAEALRVQSYPTLVLAAPDGKIIGTQEGYLEAARFTEQLQRVLTALANPEWMTRDYDEATKAIAGSDYPRALTLLTGLVKDGKERPMQVKARQLLQDLEQQSAGRLARARQMADKGQNAEAIETITELVRMFPGTQAAAEGAQMLSLLANRPEVKDQPRIRRARELLALAREDYRTQQYLYCLDRCEVLSASYGDLPEGAEAVQLAAEIKNNPEWMQQACDSLSDRLGGLYLSLAETWLRKGHPQQAALYLERVVQMFPNSRQSEAATVRLAQIQGQPTRAVDFKKP